MANLKSYDFVKNEEEVLKYWNEHQCFKKLQEKNKNGKKYRFIDGPITANNKMGVHHAFGRSLKDCFLRYKAMNGYTSHYRNGFDGVVYVPEYSTDKPKTDYVDQAEWERDALINSSVIAFWIPRNLKDMPGFTTNVEFGYYLHTGKVIYGRPNNASKIKYLDWLYKVDTNMEPFDNIEELLLFSIKKANELDNHYTEILPLEKRKVLK